MLWRMRLNWARWVPKGTIALWDGPALSAFRCKVEERDISFLIFDDVEHSQETKLLQAYLRKVAVVAGLLENSGGTPAEREAIQRFVDESAGETAELIERSLQVRAECDALVKRYGKKADELQEGDASFSRLIKLTDNGKVG